MKNTLAENMLRFGVKNLSESNIKKISESLLTEATDLMPKYGKDFTTQMIATLKRHPAIPRFYFGNNLYYAVSRFDISQYWEGETRPNHYTFQAPLNGGFSSLTTISVPGVGIVPIVPDPVSQGGEFQWDSAAGKLLSLTYTPIPGKLENVKTLQDALGGLKSYAGKVSSTVYTQLYSASPMKAQIDQAVAALKTKSVEVRSGLPLALTQAFAIPTT
jgi:hypothetical protein